MGLLKMIPMEVVTTFGDESGQKTEYRRMGNTGVFSELEVGQSYTFYKPGGTTVTYTRMEDDQ